MELNPNHATTQAIHDQWHKIALLIMVKLGHTSVVITPEDVNRLANYYPGDLPAITFCEKRDGIHIDMIPMKEGAILARQEGGLPT